MLPILFLALLSRPSVTLGTEPPATTDCRLAAVAETYDASLAHWEALRARLEASGVKPRQLPTILTHGYPTDHVIVLTHGVGESPEGMQRMAKFFFDRGDNVITVLLDGHGRTPEALKSARLEGWRANMDDALTTAPGLGKKVVLAGFSLGSALSMDAARRHPGKVAGLFLFSPALEPGRQFASVPRRIQQGREWTTDRPISDPYSYPHVATSAMAQTYRLWNQLKDFVPQWQQGQDPLGIPVAVVASARDQMIDQVVLKSFMAASHADSFVFPREAKLPHTGPPRPPPSAIPSYIDLYNRFINRVH